MSDNKVSYVFRVLKKHAIEKGNIPAAFAMSKVGHILATAHRQGADVSNMNADQLLELWDKGKNVKLKTKKEVSDDDRDFNMDMAESLSMPLKETVDRNTNY